MKILNIHFQNINSLEGESQVDFERPPFSDTGVFAITGPNGSGKSSILDVITLGLYGETFRFDRPAAYVMTKHTAECFAAIEFSLSGDKYKSAWYVQRAEGDPERELLPPEMQLVRLTDGAVLANTPHEVRARITEITGMNFRNFTRSVMLAQGDFAAFLNALDSERMDILEKIISTDIYTDYKKEVIDKAEKAQQELDLLRQKLAAIHVMDTQEQEASDDDLQDFKEQLTALQEQQNTLKEQQVSAQAHAEIEKQITEQERNLENIQAQIKELDDLLDKIVNAQEALIFKDDIDALKDKNHLIRQGKSTLDDYQSELKQLKNRLGDDKEPPEGLAQLSLTKQQEKLTNINSQLIELELKRDSASEQWQSLDAQLSEKDEAFTSLSTWMESHESEASLLTDFPEIGKLKKLRTEFIALSGQQKTVSKQSKKTIATLKNNTLAINQANNQQLELTAKLKVDEQALLDMVPGNTLADMESIRLEQQERVKDFQSLYRLAQQHKKLTTGSGIFSLFRRKEQPDHDAELLNLDLEKIKMEIKREENIKRTLEVAILNESLLKKMAPDRVHLVDGKPCTLCGALQHPYAKFPPTVSNSKQALIDQKAKIRGLLEKSSNINLKINQTQKQSKGNQAKQAQLLQIRSEWLTLCNRLNIVSHALDINNLGLMNELIKKEDIELADIVIVIKKYRGKQAEIEKTKALLAKGLTTIDQLQLSVNRLGSDNQGLSQEQIDREAALVLCQAQEKELADVVSAQLTLLGEKMPTKGQEDTLFDRLNLRRQDYHGYAFRHKALAEEVALLEAKKTDSLTEINRCNEQLAHYGSQLQREDAIGLHLGLIEKQKLITEKEQTLAYLETEVVSLQSTLQQKMTATRYTSLEEISKILELMDHQSEIEREKAEREQESDAKTIELEASYEERANDAISAELLTLNPAEIEAQLISIVEKITITSMEVQHLERRLNEQQQLQQTYDEVLLKLQQQESAAQSYFAEAALLAEESGMVFRRRVQGRMADQLLSQTNEILEKISGRYYLRQVYSEQGLALEVEDTFQANARRLPKTLSGGESFIVSLALALGLSELANNGRSVDSLFLDEGFGNLDADSLYTVISTLENLHTYGKTVGVISHVEAVQKRFKAQLQVVKKPNGMGALKKAS